MAWGKAKGWGAGVEREGANRFTQIIRTIQEVVAGGVIRHGKSGPDDDAHAGFWLGVTNQGVARFSVGGPAFWVKWTGAELLIRGRLSTLGGDAADDRLRWLGEDGEDIAYLMATDAWGHQLEVGVPRGDATGDPSQLDLFVDGDFAASLRLRLKTERAAGVAGAQLQLLAGNTTVFTIDAAGNVWAAGKVHAVGGVE